MKRPYDFLEFCKGKFIEVKIGNLTITGTLISFDQRINLLLKDVEVIGKSVVRLKKIFIRSLRGIISLKSLES